MLEVWKDIPNYEGLYQISNLGNVKSLCFGARNIRKSNIVKLLHQSPNNLGYHKVELYKDGKSKMFYVHRLVAISFIPNPDNKPQINHKDGNKDNNTVDNLEWVTSKENLHHAVETGLRRRSQMKGITGKLNKNSKKINQYDKEGNYIATYYGIAEAARILNGNANSISCCLRGRYKTACGYKWEYADLP